MADISNDFIQHLSNLATKEAQRLNHNYVGTEHLLLALVADKDGIARALSNCGITPNKVRTAVEFVVGRGHRVPEGEIRLTPRAKRVIKLAQDEARRFGYGYCGSEHLFLGILREDEGVAAGILRTLIGAGMDKIMKALLKGRCPKCRSEIMKRTVDYPVVLKDRIIIVRGVLANVCSRCGEVVEFQLNSVFEEKARHLVETCVPPRGVAEVPVYDLADIR